MCLPGTFKPFSSAFRLIVGFYIRMIQSVVTLFFRTISFDWLIRSKLFNNRFHKITKRDFKHYKRAYDKRELNELFTELEFVLAYIAKKMFIIPELKSKTCDTKQKEINMESDGSEWSDSECSDSSSDSSSDSECEEERIPVAQPVHPQSRHPEPVNDILSELCDRHPPAKHHHPPAKHHHPPAEHHHPPAEHRHPPAEHHHPSANHQSDNQPIKSYSKIADHTHENTIKPVSKNLSSSEKMKRFAKSINANIESKKEIRGFCMTGSIEYSKEHENKK